MYMCVYICFREEPKERTGVPGYLNRLIDLLLKRLVPLSSSETARLPSDRHVLSNWAVN